MSRISLIYTPVGRKDEALAIGRTLVEERLAGCVNILEGMTSIYRWDGAVQEDSEVVLLVKTRAELVHAARERIRELHRYECPAILHWDIRSANADFEEWLFHQTFPPSEP